MKKIVIAMGLAAFAAPSFLLLRFALALCLSPLDAYLSEKLVNFSFWAIQGAIPLGLLLLWVRRRQYAFALAVSLGFVLSFAVGPMDS